MVYLQYVSCFDVFDVCIVGVIARGIDSVDGILMIRRDFKYSWKEQSTKRKQGQGADSSE